MTHDLRSGSKLITCQTLWQACPPTAPFRSNNPAADTGAEVEEAGVASEVGLGVGVGVSVGLGVRAVVALGVICGAGLFLCAGAGARAGAGAYGDGEEGLRGDGLGILAGDGEPPGADDDGGEGCTMYSAYIQPF